MRIVTLTLNPALDMSTTVEAIVPWRKLRGGEPVLEPGGGGLNVARAVAELGGSSVAVAALGGHVGSLVADEVRRRGIDLRRVATRGRTRQNYIVNTRSTGEQFRFVHDGPALTVREWQRCLEATVDAASAGDVGAVVASGSVPPGVPADVFAQLAHACEPLGVPVIVDTSGDALRATIDAPVALVKPSVNELRGITGEQLRDERACEAAAREVLAGGRCRTIVVSLGSDGALFVPRRGSSFVVRAPRVRVVGTSGAGDSMVAGLTLALARGESLREAGRLGVAAGTAAVLTAGTGLCRRSDVDRLFKRTKPEPVAARHVA